MYVREVVAWFESIEFPELNSAQGVAVQCTHYITASA